MQDIRILLLICLAMSCSIVSAQNSETTISGSLVDLSKMTIERSPLIQRQKLQVDRSKASLQMATSVFDYRMRSNVSLDRNRNDLFKADPRYALANQLIQTNSLSVSTGLQRTFRSGLTADFGLEYSRIASSFQLNNFSEEVGAWFPDNYTSGVFSISQPLLRGRGRQFAAANEKASEIEVESASMNMLYISSGELQGMALAYWQYLSSFQSVQIYQENEDRVRQMLSITQELVNAEKKPAGDLVQIQADLADKERQTVLARQQLYNARQNLGRYIGLSEQESEQIANPVNEFPTLEASGYFDALSLDELIEIAHRNRPDLKALRRSQEALEVNLGLARNSLRPQLDLGGFVAYGGADPGNGAGKFATALGQVEGRNVQFGVSLNYLFPLNNNLAQGNFIAAEVAVNDQQVLIDNQVRNIELNVSIALNNLRNSVMTLEKAGQSLAWYEEVFENERVKFQNGLTTILNLIIFQERLTFAQLDYLRSQQQFAQAIISLRYETGTLLPPGSSLIAPSGKDAFYTVPRLN